MKNTIRIECKACNATGLYVGFAEKSGTAVICRNCSGNAYIDFEYTPFNGRRKRQGIEQVYIDGGLWFVRNNDAKTISIDEFYNLTKSKL